MARLYAATGDGLGRLDETGEAWTVELALSGPWLSTANEILDPRS